MCPCMISMGCAARSTPAICEWCRASRSDLQSPAMKAERNVANFKRKVKGSSDIQDQVNDLLSKAVPEAESHVTESARACR